jgi:chemotaxis protein CheD
MNHFVLPERLGRGDETRYGSVAMRRLIDSVVAHGGRMSHIEAKVFGGASLVGITASGAARLGSENVRLAYQALAAEDIPVVATDVEGHHGRKIIYHTHDGTAWVRRL